MASSPIQWVNGAGRSACAWPSARIAHILDLSGEDSWRTVHAGELKERKIFEIGFDATRLQLTDMCSIRFQTFFCILRAHRHRARSGLGRAMRVLLAAWLLAHGVAHLPGFLVSWQLHDFPDLPFHTTILADRVDIRAVGIRLIGAGS